MARHRATAGRPCWVPRVALPRRRSNPAPFPAPPRCWERPACRGRRPPGRVRPVRPVRRLRRHSLPRRPMFLPFPRRLHPQPRHPACLPPRRHPRNPRFPHRPPPARHSPSPRPRRPFLRPRPLVLHPLRRPRLLPLAVLLRRRPLRRPRLHQRQRRQPCPLHQPQSRRQRPSRWRPPPWPRPLRPRMRRPSKVPSWLRSLRLPRKAES